MEKQLLKLDVLSPLPLLLDMRNGNRQIRELREHTVPGSLSAFPSQIVYLHQGSAVQSDGKEVKWDLFVHYQDFAN